MILRLLTAFLIGLVVSWPARALETLRVLTWPGYADSDNTARQLPRFRDARNIPGISRLGEVYAIPRTYSEMGPILDRKQFKHAPTSLSVMWDPTYQGRVLAFDTRGHNFSLASLLLGGKQFRIENTVLLFLEAERDALLVAEKIRHALNLPFDLDGRNRVRFFGA